MVLFFVSAAIVVIAIIITILGSKQSEVNDSRKQLILTTTNAQTGEKKTIIDYYPSADTKDLAEITAFIERVKYKQILDEYMKYLSEHISVVPLASAELVYKYWQTLKKDGSSLFWQSEEDFLRVPIIPNLLADISICVVGTHNSTLLYRIIDGCGGKHTFLTADNATDIIVGVIHCDDDDQDLLDDIYDSTDDDKVVIFDFEGEFLDYIRELAFKHIISAIKLQLISNQE